MKPIFYSEEEEMLLSEIIKKPREFFITHKINLSPGRQKMFARGKNMLAKGFPLAYVLGFKWFFGNKFSVNPNVLIPRPETELLVEDVWEQIRKIPKDKNNKIIIADVGTGSGAIVISIAKELEKIRGDARNIYLMGTDISGEALKVAKTNARAILRRKKIKFLKGNLAMPIFSELRRSSFQPEKTFIIITANLPYLSKKELVAPSIKKEPKSALLGGKQKGFETIARFIGQIAKENKLQSAALASVFLEINYNQARMAKKTIRENFPRAKIKLKKDLAGFYRLANFELP